jgi:hypothetical protein
MNSWDRDEPDQGGVFRPLGNPQAGYQVDGHSGRLVLLSKTAVHFRPCRARRLLP